MAQVVGVRISIAAAALLLACGGDGTGSNGGGPGGGAVNSGSLFIGLKPEGQRPTAAKVIDRLRRKLAHTPGIRLFMIPVQDLRAGGRGGCRFQEPWMPTSAPSPSGPGRSAAKARPSGAECAPIPCSTGARASQSSREPSALVSTSRTKGRSA